MTHDERRARRDRAVAAIRDGTPIGAAAREHGLSLATLYRACGEAGVDRPGNRAQFRSYAVLADLFDARLTMTAIARKHGLSFSRVQAIDAQARAAGIPLPGRRPGPAKKSA